MVISLGDDTTLRDNLAFERTKLAEERTHLAYIRTGMTLALGGLFFIGYFSSDSVYRYVGYTTIVIAALFTIYGFYHHKKSRAIIQRPRNVFRVHSISNQPK